MNKTARPLGVEAIVSVNKRLETLELESYMQAFSEFMESPVKVEDPSGIKHHMGSMIRRWKRLSNEDRFRTFCYALGVAKFLSLQRLLTSGRLLESSQFLSMKLDRAERRYSATSAYLEFDQRPWPRWDANTVV